MSTIPTSLESFETQASQRSTALRTWLVGLLSLVAGAAAAGMLAGHDVPRFSGRIEAQTTFVNAGHAGIVTELLVKEGDRVSLEHPLVTLTDPELEARITQSSADLSVLLSERTQVAATAEVELAWRLKEIDDSIVAYQLRPPPITSKRSSTGSWNGACGRTFCRATTR